jgi:hypothetical protein
LSWPKVRGRHWIADQRSLPEFNLNIEAILEKMRLVMDHNRKKRKQKIYFRKPIGHQ